MVPGGSTELLVVMRFRASGDSAGLREQLHRALDVLHAQQGLRQSRLARSTDDPELVTLTLEWESVGAYRRALSSYDVKVEVVPLLSNAIDEPTAFEVVHSRDERGPRDASGSLAADAGSVRLGEAASGYVPPAS